MPKSGAIDIPHVSITDHFIRKPVKKVDVAGVKKFIGLFAINEKKTDPKIKAEAYLNQYEKFDHSLTLLDSAKKYLDLSPDYDFNLLVRLYFIKNDFQKIISLSEERNYSKSNPGNDSWTFYRIAEAYQSMGKNNEAYSYYKKATELSPYNLDFLNKLAGNLFNQNKQDEAKKIYEKIISENPKFASAYCNLGFIYFMQRDYNSAEKNYDKSLSLDPDYEIALMNKVRLFVTKGENDKAKRLLTQMVKKNPTNEKAKMILKQINTLHS